ncbi:hypothetical protein [Methanococcoides burtonii]|uniref:Uncharacterized protein n=1 Tax=Methanococcoides burtonii (strain DSM 6242 / NBRC 107633 / OCM 468 / ACE-M) TaxID=259564 RepID=Q12VC3_METBU|nr:hypothetical protein [Methanococcoides burtonii]ABE52603.1 Hypothetical protein Mbur_1711 [Methanococcoides burtonii DSM 6242]
MKNDKQRWIMLFTILVITGLFFALIVTSTIRYDILKEKHEPLFFTMKNKDIYSHKITVEIFNSTGASIFVDAYTLNSGQFMKSPSIIDETNDGDTYIYKAILENDMNETYIFTVDADAAASITVYNDSENKEAYINFGYTIG